MLRCTGSLSNQHHIYLGPNASKERGSAAPHAAAGPRRPSRAGAAAAGQVCGTLTHPDGAWPSSRASTPLGPDFPRACARAQFLLPTVLQHTVLQQTEQWEERIRFTLDLVHQPYFVRLDFDYSPVTRSGIIRVLLHREISVQAPFLQEVTPNMFRHESGCPCKSAALSQEIYLLHCRKAAQIPESISEVILFCDCSHAIRNVGSCCCVMQLPASCWPPPGSGQQDVFESSRHCQDRSSCSWQQL
jgi:hypothetical protein